MFKLVPDQTIVLGRGTKDVQIQLFDPGSSRRHAEVAFVDGEACLRDVSSAGTWINGIRIRKNELVHIKRGDVLKCGSGSEDQFR